MFSKIISPIIRQRTNVTNVILTRFKSDGMKSSSVAYRKTDTQVGTDVKSMGEKFKETGKSASYLGVIILGVGVTGTLFYTVFRELFSKRSPNNIYTAAVKRCLANTSLEDKLGLPIMSYGEETRRGRRQHPKYNGFIGRDGRKHIRMIFYLKGTFHKGTAHLEMIENDSGDFDYLYLIVEIDDLLQNVITIEDNRMSYGSNRTQQTNQTLLM